MKNSMNILIIDDDSVCNFISTRIAETSGFLRDIRSVSNGKGALEIFDQAGKGIIAAPDIILLDLNMPVMSGFDFIRALNRLEVPNKESISIIILTSSDNIVDRQHAVALGIKHYLLKPLTLNNLQSVLFSLNRNEAQVQSALPNVNSA